MPGFDRTGPMGQGSRTGRGMGYCPPGPIVMEAPARGRGFGGGFRRGRCRGFGYRVNYPVYETPLTDSSNEISALKNEASMLRQQLDAVTNRMNELEDSAE